MKKFDVLLKALTLLYREKQTGEDSPSNDLVINVVRGIKVAYNRYAIVGGDDEVLNNLKSYVEEIALSDDEEMELETILQSLSLILSDNKDIYEAYENALKTDIAPNKIKASIVATRRYLNNYYKETQIESIIDTAKREFSQRKGGVKEVNVFVDNLITKLDAIELSTKHKDPALVNEVDVGDDKTLADVAAEVQSESANVKILKTGWQGLNTMTQGGLRRGEFVVVSALQHNYKTSFVDSLFAQLVALNNPKELLDNQDKKPLMLFFSLEDPLKNTFGFLYRYFYYDEYGAIPDMSKITKEEIGQYIRDKLSASGFHVKFMRIDPSEWSYKNMFSWVLAFEAEGFEIISMVVDYLHMMPTTGCINTGPTGSDLQDLFKRTRNFMSARNILFITPHQLSTDAKSLKRSGLQGPSLLKEIANKGYYKGSKSLDQEPDLELHLDISKVNGKPYLAIKRGKHRLPSIIDEENNIIQLPFQHNAPIMPDINRSDSALYPDKVLSSGSDEFNF